MRTILIVAGEASGDLHGASLVREILAREPDARIYGLGGPNLEAAGVEILVDAAQVAVVGVTEVLAHIREIAGAFRTLERSIRERKPDLAILIDFPDFNLRLAAKIRKAGVPIVYYVSPQVWAWRQGRVKRIGRLVEKMLVIFPFEEEFYARHNVPARFVGHPLIESAKPRWGPGETRAKLGVPPDAKVVALLPGSRRSEIRRILPSVLGAAEILKRERPDLCFVLPLATSLKPADLEPYLGRSPVRPIVVERMTYEVLDTAHFAIVASGTATLETGLFQVPMVIVYRVSLLTYILARLLVRGVGMFGMVNLLMGRRVVPELLQGQATPEGIAAAAEPMLADPGRLAEVRSELGEVRSKLGEPGASARAAEAALEVAGRPPRPRTIDLYRRLAPYLAPHRMRLAFSLACMGLFSAAMGAQVFLLRDVVNKVFVEKNDALLLPLSLGIIAVFLVKGIGDYGQNYQMHYISRRMIADLRKRLFGHLTTLSLPFFHRHATGTLISRITNDVALMQEAVLKSVVAMVKEASTVLVLVATAFYMDWRLALIGMVAFPMAVLPIVTLGKKIRKMSRRSQETIGQLSSILHESLVGIRILQTFQLEEHMREKFERENERLFRLYVRATRANAIAPPLMEIFGAFGIAGVILYGGHQVTAEHQTMGQFAAFLAALLQIYKPVKDITKVNNAIQEGMAGAERVFQVLDSTPDVAEREAAVTLLPFRSAIEYRDVRFRYESEMVLNGVSLEARVGEVIALVGVSGGGKTTLVNLLPRFYDVSGGAILIDGVDIRDVSVGSLRAQIGLVDQTTFLFNDSVRTNIAYGRPDASEEEIVEAAKAAFAHGFIEDLPKRYETVIGEAGVKLSGGQRQRIAIARALLKNAPILVLDEATSALDSESEKEVQGALDRLMERRTTIVIAHRLSTVQHASRILVIEDGRIAEQGTHAELLARDGAYARLHRIQFREVES